MSALVALHNAFPWFFHYLDVIAMCFTGGSTWLFSFNKRRAAYSALIVGSMLWTGVALLGAFSGRPIYGMLVGSANTMLASVLGLYWMRQRPFQPTKAQLLAEIEGYSTGPAQEALPHPRTPS